MACAKMSINKTICNTICTVNLVLTLKLESSKSENKSTFKTFNMNFLTILNIFVIGLCGGEPNTISLNYPNKRNINTFSAIANPVEVSPEDLIVGGHETTIEEHPWQVSIQFEFTHQCSGTIIGEKWVLTTAHCLEYELHYYFDEF